MGIAQRLERLRRGLVERKLDGILISQPENCRYLSGFTGSSGEAGMLLISQEVNILATDFIHFEQAKQESRDFDLVIIRPRGKKFAELLANHALKKIGFESDALSFAESVRLTEAANERGLQIEPVEGLVESLRAAKEADEIASIESAARITDRAVEFLSDTMKPGMTEKEAAWKLESYLRENGSDHVPFDVIVASGPNAALPHAKPTDRVLAEGEPIICDLGARVDGYASDLSRTFCFGPHNETFVKVYDTVLAAQTRAMAEARAGMTGAEVDSLGREPIDKAGYAESFGHSLGHGVGLAVHERPRVGPGSSDVMVDNMVFTMEPAIYVPGWGGVRIEDMVVMDNGKARRLTLAPKLRTAGAHHAA